MTDDSAITVDRVIAAFLEIRDKRAQIKQEYDAQDSALKEKAEKLKIWLSRQMQELNTDQLSSRGLGTAFRSIKRRFNCKDWPNFWGFIKENDRFDMMQKRVGEKAVQEYMDETGEAPPGIDVFQEYEISIRSK